MITKKLLISSALSALLLVGCGGGSGSSSTTGYLVDSAVANADYDCIADNNYNKTTGTDGSFTCTSMSQVRFRVGNVVLGEIYALPSDKNVFPQDLVGVARDTGVNDARVKAMAQLLQSLDSDGNPSNGITIAQESKALLAETERTFNPSEINVYLESASINPAHIKSTEEARQHLIQTVQAISGNTQANDDTAHDNAQSAQDTAHDNAQSAQDTAHTNAQSAQDTAHTNAQSAQDTAHTNASSMPSM